jgi:hypothetical protein
MPSLRRKSAFEKGFKERMGRKIMVGTRLKKSDAPSYTLEVTEIVTPEDGLPHARTRVRLMSHDLGARLYSISALADPKLFIPD